MAVSINPTTRRNATLALAVFDETEPVSELLDQAAEDPNPEVRSAAAETRALLRRAHLREAVGG